MDVRGQEHGDVVEGPRAQGDGEGAGAAAQLGERRAQCRALLGGAVGADDHEPPTAGGEDEQAQRRLVGPVQVLQDDEHGCRRSREAVEDGVEGEGPGRPRQHRPRTGVGRVREGVDGGQRRTLGASGQRPQPGPQRGRSRLRIGLPGQHRSGKRGHQLRDQAGLADARLATDQEHGPAAGRTVGECGPQLGQQGPAADEPPAAHGGSLEHRTPGWPHMSAGSPARVGHERAALLDVPGQAARSTPWISRLSCTLSLTTTPPPSSGRAMSTPKSLRLMVAVAEKPARVPP